MRTHTTTVPGGELRAVHEGSGPPVVLLHGGALDHRMWDPQVPALLEHGTVVRPDLRGHGRSSTPTAPFRHGDDVAAVVEDLDAGPAVLVGLSLGAGAALECTLERPDLVSRVVLSGAGTCEPRFEDPWTLEILAEWQRTQEQGDAEGWVDAFVRMGVGPHRSVDEVDREWVEYTRTTARRTVAEHVRPDAVPPTPVPRSWERLTEVEVPVRSIDGALDSPDHLAMPRRVTATVRDGASTTVPGCGHYPNLERPSAFNRELTTFGLGAAGSGAA